MWNSQRWNWMFCRRSTIWTGELVFILILSLGSSGSFALLTLFTYLILFDPGRVWGLHYWRSRGFVSRSVLACDVCFCPGGSNPELDGWCKMFLHRMWPIHRHFLSLMVCISGFCLDLHRAFHWESFQATVFSGSCKGNHSQSLGACVLSSWSVSMSLSLRIGQTSHWSCRVWSYFSAW